MIESIVALLTATAFELGLFAACIFALFGIDDLIVDALFFAGVGRSKTVIVDPAAPVEHHFALFIPAWQEGAVIGPMLEHCLAGWPTSRLSIYVGVYHNDLATSLAVARLVARDSRLRIVFNHGSGPTTKGRCLNRLWHQLQLDRAAGSVIADAVLLHDAEDVIDEAGLVALDQALGHADYVQLPVVPLLCGGGRWIRRHYGDEFAESHGKELRVRAAIGAPFPTAGVGCAFRIEALAALAGTDGPFPADSLTEDYELGIRLTTTGARPHFAVARRSDGALVASRGYFPRHIADAVRQKTRWLRGNALDGWARIGWTSAPATRRWRRVAAWWMLWRDRRAVIAAAAVLTGYLALFLGLAGAAVAWLGGVDLPDAGPVALIFAGFNLLLLIWRLAMRGWFAGRLYGLGHGVMAVLRQPVSNFILVMTAWRALWFHWRGLTGQPLVWDKTDHQFPTHLAGLSPGTTRP